MSKATESKLAELHGAVAEGLTSALREGVPTVGKDGEVLSVPASAAYYMAAITMLKNNNITADPATNTELDHLTQALKERRERAKKALSKQTVAQAAAQFERELGPGMLDS